MKLGCGIVVLMWILSGCAYNDHSRNFHQTVYTEGNGALAVDNETLLEKLDNVEESKADNATDGQLEVPLTGS